jgi:uncharacterized Zn finger protein
MPEGQPWWMDDRPSRPRAVEGGIQINSTRGAVARTWWSERFITVLESLGVGGRLSRGKSYARQGQIATMELGPGLVTAAVQGTRPQPYKVRVSMPAFGKVEWVTITEALAADASYVAALLSGEMPRDIEEVFTRAGLPLFPSSPRELSMDCTCPDVQVPCKHLAAVFYVLAERFDTDPFLILTLRGRGREWLLDELRERRNAATDGPAAGVPALGDVLESFFDAGPAPDLDEGAALRGPRTAPDAILDQLPAFTVTTGGPSVVEMLRPAYLAMGAP